MKFIENILPIVEQPSRYLGSEINAIQKDAGSVKLRFALAFPDAYEIGTSHFGIQILYHILNSQPDIAAERVFAPGLDVESCLRSSGIPILSLESRTPLHEFDMIGFSLLYELNYTNILFLLDLAGIPFFSADRTANHPIIIAGGPCTCNPEPVADIFDAMVIGDGESVILKMTSAYCEWKDSGNKDKARLLEAWSRIEGVYIPSFFNATWDESGFQHIEPRMPGYDTVRRTIIPDLNAAPFPESPIIPFGKPIHDRLRLEIARGCSRGCRFCQAGMIYRPIRERSAEKILSLADSALHRTGYTELSLLSLSTGDYGCIVPVMEALMAKYASEHVAISFPSIRAGTLTPELMNLIKTVRKTGFTIAPEAGTQRLRDVINKHITQDDIVNTVQDAFGLGWNLIKLYFMVGLPTETDEDLDGMVELTKELRKIKGSRGRRPNLNISIATFIPKPHTPFQWASQISLDESRDKIFGLKDRLKFSGVTVKWQKPEVSFLEGLWARGDRKLSHLLVAAYQNGCKFDGWSDHFNFRQWKNAFSEVEIDPDFYTTRTRHIDEPLPWDFIDLRISKAFLKKEWQNAHDEILTPDCRSSDCNACGACDFETIQPVWHDDFRSLLSPIKRSGSVPNYRLLRIAYSKTDDARFFGHLELSNIVIRAIRRADIPVKFSEGFHPIPKISFEDALPTGMESFSEAFYIFVPMTVSADIVVDLLNAQFPKGLKALSCVPVYGHRKEPESSTYQAELKDIAFDPERLTAFQNSETHILSRMSRKGNLQEIDLKQRISDIRLLEDHRIEMTIRSESQLTLRPVDVIHDIFGIPFETLKTARIIKI